MTRWGEQCQLRSNSLTTCSLGAGRTPRIRFSSFMVRMDIWSSFAAQRKETRSLNNMKRCLHSSARSKKCGACQTKRLKDRSRSLGGTMNVTGQTALVVGASRGFGRGVVEGLLAKEMIVTAVARNRE